MPVPPAPEPGPTLDLNADVGESFGAWTMGDDAALLAVVTSASVACGFHAGDPSTLRATLRHAAAHGVAVGAHVAYRDLAGFGRRFLDVAPAELVDDVLYQVGALRGLAGAVGARVAYCKPHGALYNAIAHHEGQAGAVVEALLQDGGDLPLLCPPGSVVERVARERGLPTVAEAFADRAYTPGGRLVPRGETGAVLHDPDEIAARVVRLATEGTVTASDGSEIELAADSVCVHGDTPGAVAVARAVRAALTGAGVTLRAFA
jgi:5-oxoprolinase (ATP-hydrolysing) subunit A